MLERPVAGEDVTLRPAETRLERVVFEVADDDVLHLAPRERVEAAGCDMVDGSAVGH